MLQGGLEKSYFLKSNKDLLFITLSFIMLDEFHIYIKVYLCNTMLGTCTCTY